MEERRRRRKREEECVSERVISWKRTLEGEKKKIPQRREGGEMIKNKSSHS